MARNKTEPGASPVKKIIIFDCDGVMFSSREANRVYYNHLLEKFACPPMDEDEVSYVHCHNVNDSVAHIFRNHPHIDPAQVAEYRAGLDYSPFIRHMTMEPDLIDFLGLIKPRFHTAISTNRTNTMDLVLDTFQLRSWFDMVVTAENAPRPKPAPDGLFMILDHFGLRAGQAIYIGDSEVDREHCQKVGVELIAFKNPRLDADYHVSSFMEILSLPPLSGQ